MGIRQLRSTLGIPKVTFGIAIYPDNGTNSEILLRHADSRMYEIKRNGKGRFEFFEDGTR